MSRSQNISWALVVSLGAVGLVRPLTNIVEDVAGVDGGPAVPVVLSVVITLTWIAVTLRADVEPVRHLVLTGLTYGLLSIALSGVASPLLEGRLEGPLATPVAIVPVLVVNALWGALAGVLALALRRVRHHRRPRV